MCFRGVIDLSGSFVAAIERDICRWLRIQVGKSAFLYSEWAHRERPVSGNARQRRLDLKRGSWCRSQAHSHRKARVGSGEGLSLVTPRIA